MDIKLIALLLVMGSMPAMAQTYQPTLQQTYDMQNMQRSIQDNAALADQAQMQLMQANMQREMDNLRMQQQMENQQMEASHGR